MCLSQDFLSNCELHISVQWQVQEVISFFHSNQTVSEVPTVPCTAYDSLSQAEQLRGNELYNSHISQKLRMRGAVPSLPIGLRDVLLIRTMATAL
jgi:hypothetical protein